MGKPAPIEGLDRDTALDEAARRSIKTRLAEVRRFEERLVGGAIDPDDVHDMRVASRRLRAALELFERKRQLREAERAVGGADGRPGGHRVRPSLASRLKDVKRRMLAVAKRAGDAGVAHKLRIGAKKLRYAAELAQPAFVADMDALIDRLQPLQE